MDNLPEELLDCIIKHLPLADSDDQRRLLKLSRISKKFKRIVESYSYSTIFADHSFYVSKLLSKLELQPALKSYLKTCVCFDHDYLHVEGFRRWPKDLMTAFSTLDIDLKYEPLGILQSWLENGTLETLRLRNAKPRSRGEEDWTSTSISHTSVTSLHLSFQEPHGNWQECDNIHQLAKTLPALQHLNVYPEAEANVEIVPPDTSLLLYMLHTFRNQFQTSLRNLEYLSPGTLALTDWYSDGVVPFTGSAQDAAAYKTLETSHLEILKIDTLHLVETTIHGRSGDHLFRRLPATLKELYLRHVVFYDEPSEDAGFFRDEEAGDEGEDGDHYYPDEEREEYRTLRSLMSVLANMQRFPELKKVTLAVFMPEHREKIGTEMLVYGAARVEVPLDLIIG